MPNYCWSRVEMIGDTKNINQLTNDMEEVEIDGDKDYDLTSLLPTPKKLEMIHSGGNTIDGVSVKNWITVDKDGNWMDNDIFASRNEDYKDIPLSEELQQELLLEYGALDWYQWRLANWGTKWVVTQNSFETDDNGIHFELESAWSPPIELLCYIAKKYKLSIVCHWNEEGGHFGMTQIQDNGEYIEL